MIPDDGYRELKSTNQQEVIDPKHHAQKQKPVLSMINKYNIAELSLVDRPVKGTKAGFGAVIVKHGDAEGKRHFQTETRDNFGKVAPRAAEETVNEYNKQSHTLAGGQIRPYDQVGVKTISNLVGEIYGKNYDP